ncbi:MAG: N-formylglutamate amidohydrolase [Pseudomonadota bacterium]
MPDSNALNSLTTLLAPAEPPPFVILNPITETPILLVCDHASCRFPAALGDMGLDPFARRCHLAIDIGAGPLTESLAKSLGVTAILAQYSRLVIDCNRNLLDASAFLEYGDGIVVPGNRKLSMQHKTLRADSIYWPYHAAVEGQISRLSALGPKPAFISIHSFTPVLDGVPREFQIGVLWDKDESLKEIFLEGFRAAGFTVGDNEPYSGKAPADYTVDTHGEGNDLPCLGIEIRQDLIGDGEGVARIAAVMHTIIESIPQRLGLQGQKITA